MFKSGLRTLMAAVIAVTSLSPTFAQAGGRKSNQDAIGALIFGALAIYAISEIAKKDDPPVVAKPRPKPKAKRKPRRNRFVIPARCLRRFETPNGIRRGVRTPCMERRAPWVELPKKCRFRIWTDKGRRVMYGKRCLRRNGYRFS
ncbi:MAG: hypothetical protein ACPGVK_06045 [Halocynthiibacter sp.]